MVTHEYVKRSHTNLGYYPVRLRNATKNRSHDILSAWMRLELSMSQRAQKSFRINKACLFGNSAYITFCKVNQAISHHKGYNHATMVSRICIIQDGLLIPAAGVHSTQIGGLLAHGKASRHRTKK